MALHLTRSLSQGFLPSGLRLCGERGASAPLSALLCRSFSSSSNANSGSAPLSQPPNSTAFSSAGTHTLRFPCSAPVFRCFSNTSNSPENLKAIQQRFPENIKADPEVTMEALKTGYDGTIYTHPDYKPHWPDDHAAHPGPRDYAHDDGGVHAGNFCTDTWHWFDQRTLKPKFEVFEVDGQQYIRAVPMADLGNVFDMPQVHIPVWPRNRTNIYGNFPLLLKVEFLFFYIPVIIVLALAVPGFVIIYMADEAIYTTMTVKVIGRQWYWVYEVEAPPEEDDGDD
uniref:Cytochrome oxidase subunit II copper A binding domain-containing protein n=1 Tax=Chromera velia CCMP2878 TaxID=1169474 RepID=A0A0G4FT82_9ALVE|eukprot:Cvel_18635.t1-p1 / transcript=Cvel_18635.t1 / gene=Cvel_18635 / organism=Chromera_velia_CCMP2878 / gene_product=Cytochrome c oxidase subunit 2, putative / transcript_product=Cytochrome c oxidase subunit 2, putative / location=Cvel_scaffold1556:31005-34726(-) / protein_length=282 / sequence_SO=supercontig / SO=protein_coding / is_pseudo=false